jgi:predicted ATPase
MIAPDKKVTPRFVNREKELGTLKSLFKKASEGKGTVVFIRGEAGIGKTRLIEEFENHILSESARFLRGKGLYREESSPYLPFIDALNQFFAEKEEAETQSLGIMGLVSERLDTPMGVSVLDEKTEKIDLQTERNKMFETIYDLIRDISQDSTVVLFLDDLQWADKASLRLMHYLARNIGNERIMIIGAYRTEDLPDTEGAEGLTELIQRMGQEKLFVPIDIKGLELNPIQNMIEDLLDVDEPPSSFIKKLFQESEGNPYFVEEVVKSLIGDGVMDAFTRGEVNLLLEDIKIPPTIKDIMGRRIGRLDDEAKRVLMVASVIGSKFDFHVLQRASEIDEIKLLDAVDRLIETGLVHEDPSEMHEIYRFDHSQVRAAIYDSLSRSRRRVLHNKVGKVIEEHYADKLDDIIYSLARHFYIGKNYRKALRYLLLSAERATKQFALEETSSYYRTALEVLAVLDKNKDNKDLMLDLVTKYGKFLFSQGRLNDALTYYQQALDLSEEMGRTSKKVKVLKEMGHAHKYLGNYEKAEGFFEKSVNLSSESVSPQDIADVHRGLGYVHWRSGEFEDAIMHYNMSITNIEKIGDENLKAVTFIELGNVYNNKGDQDMALDYYKKSVDILERLEDYVELPRALNNLGDLLLQKEDWDGAIEHLEKAIRASEISGAKLVRAWATFNVAEGYIHKGEFEKAERILEKSFKLCIELNEKLALHGVFKNYGILYRMKKEWDKAIKYFDKALVLLKEIKVPYETGRRTYELSLVYRDMGETEKARELMNESMKMFEELSAKKELEKVKKDLEKLNAS